MLSFFKLPVILWVLIGLSYFIIFIAILTQLYCTALFTQVQCTTLHNASLLIFICMFNLFLNDM